MHRADGGELKRQLQKHDDDEGGNPSGQRSSGLPWIDAGLSLLYQYCQYCKNWQQYLMKIYAFGDIHPRCLANLLTLFQQTTYTCRVSPRLQIRSFWPCDHCKVCQYYCTIVTWAIKWNPIDLDAFPLLRFHLPISVPTCLLPCPDYFLLSASALPALFFSSHFSSKTWLSESWIKPLDQSKDLRTQPGQVHDEVTQGLLQG